MCLARNAGGGGTEGFIGFTVCPQLTVLESLAVVLSVNVGLSSTDGLSAGGRGLSDRLLLAVTDLSVCGLSITVCPLSTVGLSPLSLAGLSALSVGGLSGAVTLGLCSSTCLLPVSPVLTPALLVVALILPVAGPQDVLVPLAAAAVEFVALLLCLLATGGGAGFLHDGLHTLTYIYIHLHSSNRRPEYINIYLPYIYRS